jgi:hypothetical protein
MTDLIEELMEILNHKEDETFRRCLTEIQALKAKNEELEKIRANLLDQLDRMTQVSLSVGSGRAAASRNSSDY